MCRTNWNGAAPQQRWVAASWTPWQLQCAVTCNGPVLRSLLSSEWWLFTEYFLCPGYCTLSVFKTILHGGFCYSGCTDESSEAYIDLRYKPKPGIVALCLSVTLNFRIYGTEIARQGKSTHLLHFPPCPPSSASTFTFHTLLSIFLLSHLQPSPKPSSIVHSPPHSHQFWSRTDHTAVTLKTKKEPQERKLSFDIIVSCRVGRSHQGWVTKL